MAAELRQALTRLPAGPGAVLAGRYLSTDQARCDVENRLFTNLGASSFPRGLAAIRFERGTGSLPPSPSPVASVAGHRYYYSYRPGGVWRSWECAETIARWRRVTRRAADDGSCRPVWLAMKMAAASGQVEVLVPELAPDAEFGVRVVIHATPRGPRNAAAVSETVFASPALVVRGNYVQISPCDERCQAGEVVICPDADGPYPQISGVLYALRPAPG
ncbi:MAG: hypothetical protein WBR21_03930 [Rouxiella badensis]|uniref:hypothetical protein n=1 Tax=Rouxiella badensis TaxID=1646377 RepID=UPI003C678E75